jgi:TRAP-type mannitol/chloroaromatic compound transport system permease large subunit
MTNPEVALLMLGLFIVLVLLGFPIAFTLLAMGVGFGYYAYHQGHPIETFTDIFNNNIFYLLNQNTYSVMENPTLVAIPLFLFMGYVVERANIVDKLFFSLYMAARNLPGSLAIAALLTCAVFSTASGIVGAVVTLMGLLAFPAMANANYNKSFASGVICAGGTLGILIPAFDHADRLLGDRRPVAVAALCGCGLSRPAARRPLYCLCDRTRLDYPQPGSEAPDG